MVTLEPGVAGYPADRLQAAGLDVRAVTARGDVGLLTRARLVALFCSVRCPGRIIVQTYDLARKLRDAGVAVIGGFQSPIEKDCLELLLRGKQPVIVCPARGLEAMRLPATWKAALDEGRLLLLSPFEEKMRRPTAELALARNEFAAALADEVLIAYAEPGGKTEAFARKVMSWGKPVLTLEGPENAGLVDLGARAVTPGVTPYGPPFDRLRAGSS